MTSTSSSILLTGGTGTLGRLVLDRLLDAGRTVRVLSRHPSGVGRVDGGLLTDGAATGGIERVAVDLSTGTGLERALESVETVVHCAGSASGDGEKARTLVEAATSSGVKHLVHISVVGADRVPVTSRVDRMQFGYFADKREAEEAVMGSDIPWTVLRATQFHDFVLTTAQQLGKLPVVPVFAGVSFQPVDARDVADRLVELALGEPQGLVPDVAGPRVYPMADLVRDYLRATGRHRLVLPMHNPGRAAAAYRGGANLSPDRAVGTRTWEDFLSERTGAGLARTTATPGAASR